MKKFLISIIAFVVSLVIGVILIVIGSDIPTYIGMVLTYMSIFILVLSCIIAIFSLFKKVEILQSQHKTEIMNKNPSQEKICVEIAKENCEMEQDIQTTPKPTWEQLSEEERKPYIQNAIKYLYENQLKEQELTRQQKAFKEMCLKDNEFLYDDLTDDEKNQVDRLAKIGFETEQEGISNGYFKLTFSQNGMVINESNIRMKIPSRTINERSVEERFKECEEEKLRLHAVYGK